MLSCKKETSTEESYIGSFPKEYLLALNIADIDDEDEQKAIIESDFEKVLLENGVENFPEIKIFRISGDFFAFSIILMYDDMLKLKSDPRIETLGPNGRTSI